MSSLKAVILVGGPSRGTRFRPLSLNCPKPLFPVAGKPLLYHHLTALSKVKNLKEVFLIGFFEDSVFAPFIDQVNNDFDGLVVRYLREYQSLGTAGGIYHFRDEILRGNPQYIFILHSDICSNFPLNDMLRRHEQSKGALCTMLATRIPRELTPRYGCIVSDPNTHEILHYVEKPSSFISDLINCGVYLFDSSIFSEIHRFKQLREKDSSADLFENQEFGSSDYLNGNGVDTSKSTLAGKGILRLEQDVLAMLAGTKKLFALESSEFWAQIKAASSAVVGNALVLQYLKRTDPSLLAKEHKGDKEHPNIVGAVYIHKSATIHPTAKIGPNVSIGPRVVIGPGVRVKDSIVLDGAEIQANSCVIHSVIGWGSKIGTWVRVEGEPNAEVNHHKLMENGQKVPSATILGQEVTVANEVIIRNCIVLPHKELKSSYKNDILM